MNLRKTIVPKYVVRFIEEYKRYTQSLFTLKLRGCQVNGIRRKRVRNYMRHVDAYEETKLKELLYENT